MSTLGTPVKLTKYGASLEKNKKYIGMTGYVVGYTMFIPKEGLEIRWSDNANDGVNKKALHSRNEVVWTGGLNENPIATRNKK